MPTFERCPESVSDIAKTLLAEFETHSLLRESGTTVDFVFARADVNEKGEKQNDALTKNGVRALGIARKIALKDRALGRADAEIALDGDWWDDANDAERRALLDHELHHLTIKFDKRGMVVDDLGRPVLKLRKHDFEVGWFHVIASRHGSNSIECKQAKALTDSTGQLYWPELASENTITLEHGGKAVTTSISRFTRIAESINEAHEQSK